jgi:hypothetical protein
MCEVAELRRYARRATGSIPAGGERKDAEDELYEHALSLYEDALATGVGHEAAVAAALHELGDPEALARDLSRSHRQPLTPLAVVLLVLAAVAFVVFLVGFIVLLLSAAEYTGLILLGVPVVVVGAVGVIVILGRRHS